MNMHFESIQTQAYAIYQAAASKLDTGVKATGRLVVSAASGMREYAVKVLNFTSTQLKALAEKMGVAAKAIGTLAANLAGGAYDYSLKAITFIATHTKAGAAKVNDVVKTIIAMVGAWASATGRLAVSVAGAVREYAVKGIDIVSKQLQTFAEKIGEAAKAIGKLAVRVANSLYDYASRAMMFVAKHVKAAIDTIGAVAKVAAEKIGAWAEATGKLAVKIGEHIREFTLKAVKTVSKQLQNPRYAYGAVIISNLAFLEMTFKVFEFVDNRLNRTRFRDGNVGPKAQTFKEIMLLTGFIGSIVALNMTFAGVFKPNISSQAYIATSIATCVGHFFSRLALAHFSDRNSSVRPEVTA